MWVAALLCGFGAALVAAGESGSSDAEFYAGLNLPTTQGSSGTGAFMPGILSFTYTKTAVESLSLHGFSAIRLPVNIDTAMDAASLVKLKEYVEAVGGRAVLCMFGTDYHGDGHGTGKVDNVRATARAWATIHQTFKPFPKVKYEIFNEPFGYDNATEYYEDMVTIMSAAELPSERCILAGLSYESKLHELVDLGWTGDLGYHTYPTWLADGNRTQEHFSEKIQQDLAGLSSRVWLTEFGAALDIANPNYAVYEPSGFGGDVNCLRGLHHALLAFKKRGEPVKGAFHWHGWDNGDSYGFWASANANGAEKVKEILADLHVESELLLV